VGKDRKDTGVRYDDVAGIDNIKADIQETMKMIIGDNAYTDIGAHPFRVGTHPPSPKPYSTCDNWTVIYSTQASGLLMCWVSITSTLILVKSALVVIPYTA
jgi:hypothetical protein